MNKRINILNLALHKKISKELIKISYDFSVLLNSNFIKKIEKKLDHLSSLSKEFGEEKNLFDEFLDLNSLKFIEWDVVKEIGSGAFGTAFLMRDGRVLKITMSSYEARAKEDIIKNLYNKKYTEGLTQPMIYDVGKLDMPKLSDEFLENYRLHFNNLYPDNAVEHFKSFKEMLDLYLNQIYFSIMEKINTDVYDKKEGNFKSIRDIPKDIKSFIDLITKVLVIISEDIYNNGHSKNFNRVYGEVDFDESTLYKEDSTEDERLFIIKDKLRYVFNKNKLKILKDYASSLDDAVFKVIDNFELKNDWLDKFIKLCIHNMSEGRTDMHMGNLGIRNGYFVFFDF
jgi:hypothetical protein